MQASSGDVTYALTYVHGEKESIVAALPVEIPYAMESVLRDQLPGHVVKYNPWTRIHMVLLEGAIYMVFPVLLDGRHGEAPLARPLHAAEENAFSRMLTLPVEPVTGIALTDSKSIASVLRGRSAAVEASMRAIDLEDLPSAPERVWLDTEQGWVGVTGNLMCGVWLRRRGTSWDAVTPMGAGAVIPEGDRYEEYKRNVSTRI